ncbi:hypothetical protein CCUS01_09686 [Colletotrichum cuscutae]|uniref:Uncharacterized protein n=1 Tax=Colletotrichum cuscutae TaxID=1209917 RepID=A0AAI9UID0_9PEZI|nr:hypothetical protein CCUS01_09686 [Colletotrichum cuscutae]
MTRLHDRRRLVLPLTNRRRSGLLNGRHTMEPTPCDVTGLTSRPTHPDNLAAIPYLLSQLARRKQVATNHRDSYQRTKRCPLGKSSVSCSLRTAQQNCSSSQ